MVRSFHHWNSMRKNTLSSNIVKKHTIWCCGRRQLSLFKQPSSMLYKIVPVTGKSSQSKSIESSHKREQQQQQHATVKQKSSDISRTTAVVEEILVATIKVKVVVKVTTKQRVLLQMSSEETYTNRVCPNSTSNSIKVFANRQTGCFNGQVNHHRSTMW